MAKINLQTYGKNFKQKRDASTKAATVITREPVKPQESPKHISTADTDNAALLDNGAAQVALRSDLEIPAN